MFNHLAMQFFLLPSLFFLFERKGDTTGLYSGVRRSTFDSRVGQDPSNMGVKLHSRDLFPSRPLYKAPTDLNGCFDFGLP